MGFAGAYNLGLSFDTHSAGRIQQRHRKPPSGRSGARQRLLAGPNLPGCQGLDVFYRQSPPGGDIVNKLRMHVVDQALEIGSLRRVSGRG